MSWAHLEYFDGGVIRVFDDGKQYLVDPFVFSVAFKLTEDPGKIELVALTKPPTFSQLRAIVMELKSRGIRVTRLRISGAHPGRKEFS